MALDDSETVSLLHVRSFLALTESGSFTEVAQRLSISQPTVSQHITKLEAYLGVVLIKRNRTGCELTDSGRLFLPYAKQMMNALYAAKSSLKEAAPALRISVSSNVMTYYLIPHINRFCREYGDVVVQLQVQRNEEVIASVERGDAELGFAEWWDNRSGVIAEPFCEDELVIIFSPESSFAKKKRWYTKDLTQIPLIGGESGTGTGTIIREALGLHAEQLNIKMNVGSTEAVKRAVIENIGSSIVLFKSVEEEVKQGRLIAQRLVDKPLKKSFFTLRLRGLPLSREADTFLSNILHQ
ncbi:MAG: hypothetical protein CBC91_05750 [Rickettsiales bacterium TMED131]|nr:MAG: hypothetical protein CBC91_05750 [Rickettsiales bacterium TMED131]